MQEIKGWSRPLADLLEPQHELTADQAFEYKHILRPLTIWREHPDLALLALTGVFLPTHQRMILSVAHKGAISNVIVGSRGTSKTSVIAVLYSTVKNVLFAKRKAITLSASGFRGGQMILNDTEKWLRGAWVDQESGLDFFAASCTNDKLVHRAQNFWQIDFSSLSANLTVPTNDPEKLRGLRGTELYLDEANFMDMDLVEKVAESFLNVLQDFRYGGENAQSNVVFYTTTIDYSWREFQKTAHGALEGIRADYEAYKAAKRGDYAAFQDLEAKGLHGTSYVCFDYTDTIIKRYITTRDGRRFEVAWPDTTRRWRHDPGIPFTVRDAEGRIQREGEPVEIITTYPINRVGMEGKILRGETAEPIWLAEQRNVVDSSAGDVYPHAVVDRAVCKGNRYILPWEDCGEEYKKRYKDPEKHFVPPVMWSTNDPCVLGVDYAPGNRDFSAFVVIRVGPLALGEFNPTTGEGKTPWSNVIWCEQHRNASGENVAEKIRAFAQRYNLVYFHDPYEVDHWKLCRAIGLDVRGGGNSVRDALVFVNKETLADGEYRILDPLDDDERLSAFKVDTNSKPMLDAIKPTGQLNDKLVEFTYSQLENNLLFLPADIPMSERPLDRKFDQGFDGARMLEHQLRALQQAPTASGYRKFYMAGDEEATTNKKDFWAAFIYAAKQLRAHLLRVRLMEDTPMPIGASVSRFQSRRNGRGNTAVGATHLMV